MKTVRMNLSENALNNCEILAQEVAMFLAGKSDSNSDFEADGKQIIEYDLSEKTDPIYWTIGSIKRNNVETYDINLDC